jgi:hypothetical protein
MPNPRCIGDMDEPTKINYLTRRYKSLLTPIFKPINETVGEPQTQ